MKTVDKQLNTPDIKQKAFRFALKIFISVIVLGAIVAGAWLGLKTYDGKIFPRVTVANQKIAGLSSNEAKLLLDDYVSRINTEGPIIVYQDEAFTPTLFELGVTFDTQKVVDQAYNLGREDSLIAKIKSLATIIALGQNIVLTPNLDEDKLDNYLGQIATVVEVNPVDATLKYQGGAWVLKESSNGLGLNKNRLKSSLDDLIQTGKNQDEIVLEMTLLEPQIKAPGALAAKEKADQFLEAAPIQIEYKDESLEFEASRDEIASWVEFVPENGYLRPEVSAKKIASFIDWIASKIEITKIDKEVVDGTGEIRTAGQNGRGVNRVQLTEEIKDRVEVGASGAVIKITTFVVPYETVTFYPSAKPGRYASRYIDVNLSEQKLYAFEGSKLVNEFLISSGRSGYKTPPGEFSVWGKTRSQVMDGPDFYLPNVQWISWFNGEISVHGTYWHNNFGTPMSHGCINASNENAEWVYNFVDIGTPVYVHY